MAASTIVKKASLQPNVFEGISAIFAVEGGFTFSGSAENGFTLTLAENKTLLEFPCSEDSGFNFDTGAPSIEHFKVHGLNADWVSTFTPGDTELSIEIPCHDTQIMSLCFGSAGSDTSITLPVGALKASNIATAIASGKSFGAAQKSVELGLLILDDTEQRLFYVKKAKLTAQVTFDGSNKPLCVVLSGSLSESGDGAFGILDIATTASNG
jgi:hypothetical protein